MWAWLTGVGLIFLMALFGLLLLLSTGDPGFTLIVKGAPPGSLVRVDTKLLGIPMTDGTIKVPNLATSNIGVQISCNGYKEYVQTVNGRAASEGRYILNVNLSQLETSTLSKTINYNGEMVLVPAGEFIMGDDNHLANEKPGHMVNLQDYYIDKFEVTNREYKKFCEATNQPLPSNPWWDEKYFDQCQDCPVVGVDFNQASAYAQWVGKRLPTEEEWEKAASWDPTTKSKRLWPWGNTNGETALITAGNVTPSQETRSLKELALLNATHPSPVGQYPMGVSAYGVYDMAGNATEWVDSYYQPYAGNSIPDTNYGNQNRVVKGGHFGSSLEAARTSRRVYNPPTFQAAEKVERSWLIGFRCAVSANDPSFRSKIK